MAHTYDEQLAMQAYTLISEAYYKHMQFLLDWFAGQNDG